MDKHKKRKSTLNVTSDTVDNSNNEAAIFILNEDCMRHIFSFLSIKERIKIQRVCKKWQKLINLPWNDVKKLQVSFESKSDRHQILYTLPILKKVLRHCGASLTKLQLGQFRYEHGFNKSTITLIRKLCPNLKSLDISKIVLTQKTAEFIAENFCNLTSIAIGYCMKEGCGKNLSKLLSSSKCLKSVELRMDRHIRELVSKLPLDSIESLSFGDECSSEDVVSVLPNFKKLRSFSLDAGNFSHSFSEIQNHIEEILLALSRKDHLNRLFVSAGRPFSDKVVQLHSIRFFTNLQKLDLRGSLVVHNDVLSIIGSNCKNLAYLSLADSSQVTDTGFTSLFPLLKLEEIVIQFLSSITERFLAKMQMSSLKTFICYHSEKINVNEAVKLLMLGSQNLRQIKFVTDDDMNLKLGSIVEETSEYVGNQSNNYTLKLLFYSKNLPKTLHMSKNLQVRTENHCSDFSDVEACTNL